MALYSHATLPRVLRLTKNDRIKATLCLARKKRAKAQRGWASRKSRTNEYAPL